MGDRIVHDGVYDAEGHLISRDEALRPLDPKGSKRFGKRRQRHNFTWLGLLLVVGLAGWGLWALASSLQHNVTQNFNYVQVGELKGNLLSQMGSPCHMGHLVGDNGQVNGPAASYYVWADGNQWDLIVMGHPVTGANGSGHGLAVLAKFTAYRGLRSTNFCRTGVNQNPYSGRPWIPTA